MARLSPYRIKFWDIGANRGRGSLKAIIDDASDIGCSTYANDMGEMFFTIPQNHPQIAEMVPLQRHYEVQRRDRTTNNYEMVHVGILEDYEATADEVVFYGHDYLGLLTKSILPSTSSYTNTLIGDIIQNTWTARKTATNSPTGFITTGGIAGTGRSVTIIAPFEEQLSFYSGLCEIVAGSGTTRPIVGMTLSYAPTFFFDENRGSDKSVRLEYGAAINDFRFNHGGAFLRTNNKGIGVKREGATVLYSDQEFGSPSTYGDLEMASLYTDIINAAELSSKTLATLKDAYYRSSNIYISLAQGHCKPLDGWDIADSIKLVIRRGVVDIDTLYTIWGWEWIGRKDGSESLFLDVQLKLT